MRRYQIVTLLVVCIALAFVVGLKLRTHRVQQAAAAEEDAETLTCECEVPVGWDEVLAAREEDAPQIPPTPGKPCVVGFVGEATEESDRVESLLAELRPQVEGVADVAVVEADVYRDLAAGWRLRMVPTVIFLDADGEEHSRHEGQLSAEEMLAELRAAGAEIE